MNIRKGQTDRADEETINTIGLLTQTHAHHLTRTHATDLHSNASDTIRCRRKQQHMASSCTNTHTSKEREKHCRRLRIEKQNKKPKPKEQHILADGCAHEQID